MRMGHDVKITTMKYWHYIHPKYYENIIYNTQYTQHPTIKKCCAMFRCRNTETPVQWDESLKFDCEPSPLW